jgi:hypothetical protein
VANEGFQEHWVSLASQRRVNACAHALGMAIWSQPAAGISCQLGECLHWTYGLKK